MKINPIAVFTGIAILAAGALGYLVQRQNAVEPVVQTTVEEPAPAKPAEAPAATAEAPAEPAPEKKVETPAQVATAPATTEEPAPAKPVEPAPEAAAPVAEVPTFDTVRVEQSGEAVIAGRSKPGVEVVAKHNGVVIGAAVTNDEGSFVIIVEKPLPPGPGVLTLQAKVDGKSVASVESVAVDIRGTKPALVAKIDPGMATKVLQTPASSGEGPNDVQLSTVDYDQAGNIVFSGRASPGGTVRFYVDNEFAGELRADDTGAWVFKGVAPIAAGTHMLRADEVDASGKVKSRAEIPFLREEVEKVLATAEPQAAPATQQPAAAETAAEPATEPAATEQSAAAASTPETAEQPQPETAAAPADSAEQQVALAPASEPGGPQRIVIQPGNNLWRISRQVYGKGKFYTVIFEANRDQVKNPNRIYPGQILAAPEKQQ